MGSRKVVFNKVLCDDSPHFRTIGNNSSMCESLDESITKSEMKNKRSTFQKFRPKNIETFTVKKDKKINI